jgi:hypothetical protein
MLAAPVTYRLPHFVVFAFFVVRLLPLPVLVEECGQGADDDQADCRSSKNSRTNKHCEHKAGSFGLRS